MLPYLMHHVFCVLFTWEKRWQQDTQEEEGRPVEVVIVVADQCICQL